MDRPKVQFFSFSASFPYSLVMFHEIKLLFLMQIIQVSLFYLLITDRLFILFVFTHLQVADKKSQKEMIEVETKRKTSNIASLRKKITELKIQQKEVRSHVFNQMKRWEAMFFSNRSVQFIAKNCVV